MKHEKHVVIENHISIHRKQSEDVDVLVAFGDSPNWQAIKSQKASGVAMFGRERQQDSVKVHIKQSLRLSTDFYDLSLRFLTNR